MMFDGMSLQDELRSCRIACEAKEEEINRLRAENEALRKELNRLRGPRHISCYLCANGNDLPDGEQCAACGRVGDLPSGASQ